jgi:hypothetical protein
VASWLLWPAAPACLGNHRSFVFHLSRVPVFGFWVSEHNNNLEADSVTAENTPRVRKESHSSWTSVKIGGFTGKLVRLTGWLIFDSAHAHHSHKANNDDRDHAGFPLNRATNWEVHPVTKFEFCNSTIATCKPGTGWKVDPTLVTAATRCRLSSTLEEV